MIISANICVSDIEKDKIYTSPKTGKKYLRLELKDYRNGPDNFENDGSVAHSTTQEERTAGSKGGTFCGSWRWVVKPEGLTHAPAPEARPPAKLATSAPPDDDEIPF
jgi:hypothetical protein